MAEPAVAAPFAPESFDGAAAAPDVRAGGITVQTITDVRALAALRKEWIDLVEDAGADHPFLTHEWILTWWECFGDGSRMHILVARQDGRAVAIAPLMLTRARMYGMRIRLLHSIHNDYTMRSDLIVSPRHPEAIAALWRHLLGQKDLWDLLELRQIREDSPTIDALTRLARRDGCLTGLWRAGASPYLPIRGSWEDYLNGLDRKHRANLRNRFKRLGRLGAVELKIVSSAPELTGALETGFRLEAEGWKGRAGTAIECHPMAARFFTLFARRAARRGWLRLHCLVVDGREIAFDYSLRFHDRVYLLKPAYDPAYAAYSPYNLLCSMALNRCFEQGVEEFDFLGEADPWKLSWSSRLRPHCWLYVFPDRPWARTLRFAKFRAVPWIKRLRKFTPRGAEVERA